MVSCNCGLFDPILINLRNYLNLSATNVPEVDLGGLKLDQLGQGSGLLGLPGDFTPPSRFVRAAVLSQSAKPVATAKDGINLASHILDSFDIFPGIVREKGAAGDALDLTQWTSFADLKNKCYYVRTYENQRIRKVDLAKLRFDGNEVLWIPMNEGEVYEDLTERAKAK
ncbi:linear amide C-N hydrolase [Singulisphaera rosea]